MTHPHPAMADKKTYLLCLFLLFGQALFAQNPTGRLAGTVWDEEMGESLPGATLVLEPLGKTQQSDAEGRFAFEGLPYGRYRLVVFALGKNTRSEALLLETPEQVLRIGLSDLSADLNEVLVQDERERAFGLGRLRGVENMGIYEGKKSEVVLLDNISANLATNNARQVFARVAGLNIWESDGAGLQLGIGGRGLSPNRTSNFNTRQNGYDISADALGYPESYYTPPIEALERIEVLRGAASLQYGTQFGGLLNFVFRKPGAKPLQVRLRQSVGSYGFVGSYNEASGTLAKGKLGYLAFYQYKRGDGWRANSGFENHNAFAQLQWRPNERLRIGAELTLMHYLAQQPGGLTDAFFEADARQSLRGRNWFEVDWRLLAISVDYRFSARTQLNSRSFGLLAGRQALGNLAPINNIDFGGPRDLISGSFRNLGNETRLLHRYRIGKQEHTLLLGLRLYQGTTGARQGEASAASDPDFRFLNPDDVERSDYLFPNYNTALFAEHIFYLSPRFTLTPGLRYEHILTLAEGYYKQRVFDAAGNLVAEQRQEESLERGRSFLLGGLGFSYKHSERLELYANISQNYRAINFSDLRIDNPNGRVDPDIRDERGYTADLGLRYRRGELLYVDVTAFYLAYRDRIGLLLRADQPPLYNDYRLRTNIADARNIGLEAFVEWDLWRSLFPASNGTRGSLFLNLSAVDARYINTDDSSIRDKQVELVPPVTLRTGFNIAHGPWRIGGTWAYTHRHYTDATNAERTASAVNGIIPSYAVADLTAGYTWRWLNLSLSANNLFDARYFTRRAEGYPGPGIIPADGRSLFLGLGVCF